MDDRAEEDETNVEPIEKRVLKANQALQKELHKEYMDLLTKIDLIALIKRRLAAAKKKEKKRLMLARDPDDLEERERLAPAETRQVLDRIEEYVSSRGLINLRVDSKEWNTLSQILQHSKKTCLKLWYSPKNAFYAQGKFTNEEDEKILKSEGEWFDLIQEIKRAPFSIFLRYKELHKVGPTSHWTEEEDQHLKTAVAAEGSGCWVKVAAHFKNKTPRQCMYRYIRALAPNIRKGKWTEEEDQALLEAVKKHKKGNWARIKEDVPGRSGFQCRERYTYALDPEINSTPWSKEEEDALVELAQEAEPVDWVGVAKHFVQRNSKQCRTKYHQLKRGRRSE